MNDKFAFNARQYFDFNEANNDEPDDTYFDSIATENTEIIITENVTERENSDPESDAYFSPIVPDVLGATVQLKKNLQRSSSMGHLPTSPHNDPLPNGNHMEPPAGVVKRVPSQDCINRLSQPKRWNSHENLTLAEAVVKFQATTPKRFRSKASPKRKESAVPWHVTKGCSPQFKTTTRTRPVHALSKEEREIQELEEAKKYKIRAHPVNKNVLRGPLKPTVAVKPTTVVEPFNLKPISKKTTEAPQEEKIVFKAQPIPKSLNNPFKPRPSTYVPTRERNSTNSKKSTKNVPLEAAMKSMQPFKPSPTELKPFSFEKRDKQLMKKKEELINKVLEEEKKAREFHARPLPKSILRQKNDSDEKIHEAGPSNHVHRAQSNDEMSSTRFKAKPAVVLQKKPFEPKKDEHHHLKVEAFQFTTDHRLEARHKFEEMLREKEAAQEAAKKAREEEARRLAEEEVAQLRKQMEYKAQPVKKYKEFTIEHETKVTVPISPKFYTDRIRNKENKENVDQ